MANDKKVNGLLMVTFREAVFGFEVERDYQEDEGQVLCDLKYIEDKYVYVFTTDPKNTGNYRLAGEYFGLGKGDFAIGLIDEHKGEYERPFSDAMRKNVIIPVVVNGNVLEIYACLSEIQLPWKRIEEIRKDPSKRCFKLGNPKGGLCWVPNCVERNIASLSGINDARIANPGNSVVVVGLFDHLREADRRAQQFRAKLDKYLQTRFDCNELGESSEQQVRLQMKKYGAGLVLNLIQSNHPHVTKFRAALKNNGRDLETFIIEENKKEIRIRQDAEKAAYSVARWIDDTNGVFEEVLADYTADEKKQEQWDYIQDFYCGLLNRFNELSITRKYVSEKWKNRDSWMQKYLLNENAFQSYRKVTTAVAEFLGVMSEVAYRKVDVQVTCEAMEGIYRVWFRGIILEVFSDKRVKKNHYYLPSITVNTELEIIQRIRISEQCEPLENLGNIADSKALKGVLVSLEIFNMGIAAFSWHENFRKDDVVRKKSNANALGSFVDLLVALGDISKKAGKTPLSLFGTVSAVIDSGLALYESTEEYKDKDYDAMISKIFAGAGAATIAVGSAMVTAAAFSGAIGCAATGASLVTIAQTVWMYGIGSTASGVGSPVGGALIFIGTVAFAAGTIAYFFTNDSKTEEWLKQSQWGDDVRWNFEQSNEFVDKLDVLHGLLYSFKAEVWYDPWKKRAGVRIKSVFFQAETKVIIQEMVLNGDGSSEKIITAPMLIDDQLGHPKMEIEVKTGQEVDLIATIPHETKLRITDVIEANLQVDLFGNNKVILPNRNQFVTCKARVYG